jgi:CBS domain-containing protein
MKMYPGIKVGSVMSSEYFTIDHSSTMQRAIMIMNQKDTPLLVVVNKEKLPVGILTERDIVIRVLGKAKKMNETLVEEIMTSPVRTCGLNTPITDAMRQMVRKKIRQLVVVKNGILMGLFNARDALNIATEIIDILAELVSAGNGDYLSIDEGLSGYCDECAEYSDVLKLVNGRYICEYCIELLDLPTVKKEGDIHIF